MHGMMVAVAGGYDVRNYCPVTISVGDDSDTHSKMLPIPKTNTLSQSKWQIADVYVNILF